MTRAHSLLPPAQHGQVCDGDEKIWKCLARWDLNESQKKDEIEKLRGKWNITIYFLYVNYQKKKTENLRETFQTTAKILIITNLFLFVQPFGAEKFAQFVNLI